MAEHWLKEQLKTLKNLCTISELLIEQEKDDLLPTVLELIQIEAQQIVEENCIVLKIAEETK